MVENSSKKTYWLINQYASTLESGMGGRHYYLAAELAKQGHQVYLIAGGFTHLLRQPPVLTDAFTIQPIADGFSFVWVKMPEYSGAHDKKRILNWIRFAWMLLKLPSVITNNPDAILYSSPALIPFLGARRLAKKLNAKLVFEVRDIWPLSLVELGGYSPKHVFVRLMQWIEDKAYRDASVVVSNLPNAVEHMVVRGMKQDKFAWIANGFNVEELENAQPLSENIKSLIPKNEFVVGYTGTLGVANALEAFIEAAALLKNEKDVKFVLVGSGQEKIALVDKAKNLNNIVFIDAIPKQQIQSMLVEFDVCYIGWKKEPIYRFGIAPNKLPEYMLASKPIVHAYSGVDDVVKIANAGFSVPAEDPQAIADAVLGLKSLPLSEREKMGENGRVYALEHFDYAKLAKKLEQALC